MPITSAPPLSVPEAQTKILDRIRTLDAERVPLGDAAGRVAAESVASALDLPPWDNSAMDGYAVRSAEVAPGSELPVALDLPAGSASGQRLPQAAAARITTGAPLPEGADAVVPVEDTTGPAGEGRFAELGERVRFDVRPQPGDHVRWRGEDVRRGAAVLEPGDVLRPARIALLATVGRGEVAVVRRPRVAIVSTGDELVDIDQAGAPDRIVNGNAHGIAAQVAAAGGDPRPLPIAPDEPAAIRASIRAALEHDAVVTIGGVSVGPRDHVREALREAGVELVFWRAAIRPGGPVAFGVTADGRPVFGLPGNPVSAHVTFELFARPALRRMAGHARCFRRPLRARLSEAVSTRPEKAYYLRVRVEPDGEGWLATPVGAQGSAVLTGLAAAHGLAIVPLGVSDLPAGAEVDVLPLDGWAAESEAP
ncbi:MAG TPA: gephyrin-like molybdotransferase Glp [Gemmatimonadota bacterium]|jgi:molybdopterin molybdotransferase|nr:gephyrin-like molybdotransferase Glp [Gemmatimonadota bacterium]